ncbi:MAG TPA: glycogen-binding domain-containing protein [Longimicrobium sp.]|nr:glycogen-binding domain-containing protein [Longimicrobium sp.]
MSISPTRVCMALAAACAAVLLAGTAGAQVSTIPFPAPASWAFGTDASRDAASDAWIPQLSTAGRTTALRWRGFGLEATGEGMALFRDRDPLSARGIGGARLTLSGEQDGVRAGLWAGAGAGRTTHEGRSAALFMGEAGANWRWKRAGVSLSVRQTKVNEIPATFRDSLVEATDTSTAYNVRIETSPRVPSRRYTEAELLVDVPYGPLRLEARSGGRLQRGSRRALTWAQAAADLQLSRRAAVTLAAGRLRGTPELASRPSPFLSLSLRVLPGRSAPAAAASVAAAPAEGAAFEVISQGTARTFTVRAPGATRVEIMADFTDWQPRALTPGTEPGTWRVTLPISPGTYRINLRVDGAAWGAPPGLPDVEDEFGGRVGLLVIG